MAIWDASAVRRIIRAHGRTVAETGTEVDLEELIALRSDLDSAIADGVYGMRDRGLSWQNIADCLGVTKSAAYQRFGKGSS